MTDNFIIKNAKKNDVLKIRSKIKSANLAAADKLGKTALHYASELGHSETIATLLENGAPTVMLRGLNTRELSPFLSFSLE